MDFWHPNGQTPNSWPQPQTVSIPSVWPAQADCGSATVSVTATEKDPHVVVSYVNDLNKQVEVLHAELSDLFQRLDGIVPPQDSSGNCAARPTAGPRGSSPLASELYGLNERLHAALLRIQDFRRRVEL